MREGDRQLTTSGRSEEKDVTLAQLWTIFLLCCSLGWLGSMEHALRKQLDPLSQHPLCIGQKEGEGESVRISVAPQMAWPYLDYTKATTSPHTHIAGGGGVLSPSISNNKYKLVHWKTQNSLKNLVNWEKALEYSLIRIEKPLQSV